MTTSKLDYFRAKYQAMAEDEFGEIAERAIQNPDSLDDAAIQAAREVIAQRGLKLSAVVQAQAIKGDEQASADNKVRQAKQEKRDKEAQSFGKLDTPLSYLISCLGLSAAGIIGVISLMQMNWGGLFASLFLAITSGYLLFKAGKNN
jgi:ABC-type multidrug transport system fused ATPase/permease subunit